MQVKMAHLPSDDNLPKVEKAGNAMIHHGLQVSLVVLPDGIQEYLVEPGVPTRLNTKLTNHSSQYVAINYNVVGGDWLTCAFARNPVTLPHGATDDNVINLTAKRDYRVAAGTHEFTIQATARVPGLPDQTFEAKVTLKVKPYVDFDGELAPNVDEKPGAYTFKLVNRSNTQVTFTVTAHEFDIDGNLVDNQAQGAPEPLTFRIEPNNVSLGAGSREFLDVLVKVPDSRAGMPYRFGLSVSA
jgi:hypothetical protein